MELANPTLTKICVNLFDADLTAIREIAAEDDRDVSYVIRRIVHDYISGEKRA